MYEARFGPIEAGSVSAGAIVELKPPAHQRRSGGRRRPDRAPPASGPSLVGRSDAWRRVVAEIEVQAAHDHPVLLAGPRGVGKLRCATAIHAAGRRRSQPMTVLDAVAERRRA